MPLNSNLLTGGLGPGYNYVLGGIGGNLFQDIIVQKVRDTRLVTGYWGRNIHQRVLAEFTIQKTRALMQDHILAGGIPADLWLSVMAIKGDDRRFGVTESYPGEMECSCFKKTSKQSDRKCQSCYGQRLIPGFRKFGNRTYFMASIDPTLTLNNLVFDRTFTPNRLVLSTNATSGSAESIDYPYGHDTTDGSVWTSESVFIQDDPQRSSILSEFSTDFGVTYYPLSEIGVVNPSGAGHIRFRVTIGRETVHIPSPFFEILRARHPVLAEDSLNRKGPRILVLKTVNSHTWQRKVWGQYEERPGYRYWTSPLSFFDPTIPQFSKDEAIRKTSFIELLLGQDAGDRFPVAEWSASDPLAMITRQYFTARQAQETEYYSLVF